MESTTDVDFDKAVARDTTFSAEILSAGSQQDFDRKFLSRDSGSSHYATRGKKDHSHVRESSGDGGEPKKVRKEVYNVGIHPREHGYQADDDFKMSTVLSITDLDRFRHDGTGLRNSSVSGDAAGVTRTHMELEGFAIRDNARMEVVQAVDRTLHEDEVVEVGGESQFTVLLDLCGEEVLEDVRETNNSGTGLLLERDAVVSAPCSSRLIESLVDEKYVPCRQAEEGSATVTEGQYLSGSVLRRSLQGSSVNLDVENGALPVFAAPDGNSTAGVQPVDLNGDQNFTGEAWEDDTDDISCMMTQQCLLQLEQVESPRKTSLPVQNLCYSPCGLDSNQAGLSAFELENYKEEQRSEDELCEDTTDNVSLMMTQQCPKQLEHLDSSHKSSLPLQDANFSPSRLDSDETDSCFIQPENCSLPLQDICYLSRIDMDRPFEDCTDDISCMMTQQCLPRLNVRRRSSSLPLQDITNLVDARPQRLKEAADRMESVCIKSATAVAPGQEKIPTTNSLRSPCGTKVLRQLEIRRDPWEAAVDSEDHRFPAEHMVLHDEGIGETIFCPVCGDNISEVSVDERLAHTNFCLDKLDSVEERREEDDAGNSPTRDGLDRVRIWLESISLARYASLFVEQEIDWDTLQWLTEEDLFLMGISAVGPRRKIVSALQELKTGNVGGRTDPTVLPEGPSAAVENTTRNPAVDVMSRNPAVDGMSRNPPASGAESANRITNYFPLPPDSARQPTHDRPATGGARQSTNEARPSAVVKNKAWKRPRSSGYRNTSGIPAWMCIPGTSFRVDAFQHLSGECFHWFLTHFHTDHYQGLTRGFRYGRIYCSLVTARLVNLRIGVSWERLMIMPLNEKFKIDGVDVTFVDANHCPGSVMILFEPPNGEAVLHTGDFRFCTEMTNNSLLQSMSVHTLVLDTTYCDPQYDFPCQEAVVRFVIEAIQAEAFNSETLFLIGTYTIGKERLFLEVGKVLKKFVYVSAAKKKLLDCMDLTAEDTHWLTCNSQESFIHVVPLWSISSFKRMSSISRHYKGKFKLIVAFSPSGWSFGRGKKKTPGKRWQQGTMIRYEVPYSEHSSFSELKEFLKFVAPEDIIPSVPAKSGKGAEEMLACLWSEDNAPS